MDANRKSRGSSFIKGKLVMSFHRSPPKATTSVQYSTNKAKPSPPPSTTSNKKVAFVTPDGARDQELSVPSSNPKISYAKSDGARDTKGYVKYSEYGGVAATGDDSVDLKAASLQATYLTFKSDSGLNGLLQKEGTVRMVYVTPSYLQLCQRLYLLYKSSHLEILN